MPDQAQTHSRRATAALRKLAEDDPALGALSLWCRHTDGPLSDGIARTDGTAITYGPAFDGLPLPVQVGVVAHHVMHVAFRHSSRGASMARRFGGPGDLRLFNVASDALINQTLHEAGFAIPRPSLLLRDLAGVLDDDTRTALATLDAETLFIRLRPDNRPGNGPARQGGGDVLEQLVETSGYADDLGAGRPDEATSEDMSEWSGRIARALAAGRRAGRGIGALGFDLGDVPKTSTPWETVLRALLDHAVRDAPRPSHARPARRWLATEAQARKTGGPVPVFEPSQKRIDMRPRIAVCLDSSSSIDAARLRKFAGEIAGIGLRTGAEMHAIVFDETVLSNAQLEGRDWMAEIAALDLARDGGTDFRPALAAARLLQPSAIVVLTDLDGPWGKAPGSIPVIWAVTAPPPAQPDFGRVVSLAA
ncbi:MAG: VWA-like domain-containing protein [Pseudomonadota bacterium]